MKMKTKAWVPLPVLLWIFCGWSSINGDGTAVDAAVTLQQQTLGDLDNDDGNGHGSASGDASGMNNPFEEKERMYYKARIQELEDFITDAQLSNIAERRRVMQDSTPRSHDEGYRATTADTQRRQKSKGSKKNRPSYRDELSVEVMAPKAMPVYELEARVSKVVLNMLLTKQQEYDNKRRGLVLVTRSHTRTPTTDNRKLLMEPPVVTITGTTEIECADEFSTDSASSCYATTITIVSDENLKDIIPVLKLRLEKVVSHSGIALLNNEDTNEAPAEEEEEEDAATISPSASPSSPMIQEGIGISPSLYMNWSFNRAMSAITIGSKSSTTNPATTYTILGNGQGGPTAPSGGSLNGFTVTAATYNADANANAAGVNYGVETQINQQSSTMSVVTAITIIVPYIWDLNLASFQPDITNSDVIYFLVGCTDGNMWLCNINPSTTSPTQATCGTDAVFDWFPSNNHITGTISEIAYIPQSKTVVVMTFQGALTPFSVVFDGTKPTLSPGESNIDYYNDDPQNLYYEDYQHQNLYFYDYALFLPRSVAVVYINSDTTYLYVAGLYPTKSVPGYSVEGNYAAPLMIFTMDADRTISYTGSIQNTAQTYQVIPVLTGIYFTSYGNTVSYIPFVQPTTENSELAPNGMLGSNPAVYTVYAAKDSYHLVTSIAFSANPSNVVIYVDPTNSSTPEYAFEGGALFINVATVDDACSQDTRPHWIVNGYGQKSRDTNVAGNTCFGSIFLSDACTGETSLAVENEIPGPVYTSLPGLNMDMFGQNGQGGLTFFSVAYTPGIVSNAALVTNQAFEVICKCSNGSKVWKDIKRFLAVAVLVAGVAVFPELGPLEAAKGVNRAVAIYGLGSATAGVATSFNGVIPNQPYCGSGSIGNGQCAGDLCCSQSGYCVTCPTPAPAPTPPPVLTCSIEFGPCTADNYDNVLETRCCDDSQLPGEPIVTCNAEYGQCLGQGGHDAKIYTPWAQCSTNQFGINFCEDWCNVSDYWPNCGTSILDANDPRNAGTSDYVCSCTGCNGCDSSSSSIQQCSTNQFGLNFCEDWCNTSGYWNCGTNELNSSDERNTSNDDYVCSCTGCNGCDSSIQKCSTDQFNINFCDDWCNVRNLWPNCGTNTVTQRTGRVDLMYGTNTYEYSDYTCSCNGCNGCAA